MTAHELGRLLLAGPNLRVHFAYDYGDRIHTLVAPPAESVAEGSIRYSDYHRMPRVIEEDDGAESGDFRVVIIS